MARHIFPQWKSQVVLRDGLKWFWAQHFHQHKIHIISNPFPILCTQCSLLSTSHYWVTNQFFKTAVEEMAALAVVSSRKRANSAVFNKAPCQGHLPLLCHSQSHLLHTAGKALRVRCTAGQTSARGLLKQSAGRRGDRMSENSPQGDLKMIHKY